jgi:hypothetical protein
MGSSTESNTQSLNFPLTVINGIARRERESYTHKDTKHAKLEQLHLTRLIRRDPNAIKLDM